MDGVEGEGVRVAGQLRPGDPRAIGPYQLTGWLGDGGMGEVFLGRSAGRRLVAVKVIRPELAADDEFRIRFRREVAAARRVNGLYTATVVDADSEGPAPWLATAYVPGPSLEAAVDRHGPLPGRSVLALAAGLAEGLGAVHAAGLVHRDVKPSNVLLARDGPRLIDFGIAWDVQSTALTMAGAFFGSAPYVSPEYAAGREYGPPSDVFSLGAVLAYAATGRPPFTGATLDSIITRIVDEAPDLAGVPAEARPIIEWCLIKDPAARPTPTELVARLGDALLRNDWLSQRVLADVADDRDRRDRQDRADRRRCRDDDTQTIDRPSVSPVTALTAPTPAGTAPSAAAPDPPTATDLPAPRGGSRRGWSATAAIRAIARPALVAVAVLAVAGAAGLWLALGHRAGSVQPTSTGSTAPTGPATAVASPYRFAVSGAVERGCATAVRSASGLVGASVVFDNRSAATMHVAWVDYRGRESPDLDVTLRPGSSERVKGGIGDAWQLDGPRGCIGQFITGAAARIIIEGS